MHYCLYSNSKKNKKKHKICHGNATPMKLWPGELKHLYEQIKARTGTVTVGCFTLEACKKVISVFKTLIYNNYLRYLF